MMMTNDPAPVVLVIDDEVPIRRFLRAGFELDGLTVLEAATAGEGLRAATLQAPDLIILDLGLPDANGAEVVDRLRAWSKVPIIVLSVNCDEAEKVRLLELGADDYVVKPFGMAELLARSHAALRRYVRSTSGEPVVKAGPLMIDLASRRVYLEQSRISLTRKEYQLLQTLGQHAGNVVTHQHLLKELWGSSQSHLTQYLRILVRKLRQKIERDPTRPDIIVTEIGVGYRLAQSDGDDVGAATAPETCA
jgi:two-component system KDP operon response regulator KdpE